MWWRHLLFSLMTHYLTKPNLTCYFICGSIVCLLLLTTYFSLWYSIAISITFAYFISGPELYVTLTTVLHYKVVFRLDTCFHIVNNLYTNIVPNIIIISISVSSNIGLLFHLSSLSKILVATSTCLHKHISFNSFL
jgi:Flp pilus assembly protein protease CpaA